jgi:hypothetical protein
MSVDGAATILRDQGDGGRDRFVGRGLSPGRGLG